jgi:hypothetical protein
MNYILLIHITTRENPGQETGSSHRGGGSLPDTVEAQKTMQAERSDDLPVEADFIAPIVDDEL